MANRTNPTNITGPVAPHADEDLVGAKTPLDLHEQGTDFAPTPQNASVTVTALAGPAAFQPSTGTHVPNRIDDASNYSPYDLYLHTFDAGISTVPTSGANHECGLAAILESMSKQFPTLPQPTMRELRHISRLPELGIVNHRNYADSELEQILVEWGHDRGLNFQLGYVAGETEDIFDGVGPVVLTFPVADPTNLHLLWIHNDVAGYYDAVTDKHILHHWSGLEPGVHPRDEPSPPQIRGDSNITSKWAPSKPATPEAESTPRSASKGLQVSNPSRHPPELQHEFEDIEQIQVSAALSTEPDPTSDQPASGSTCPHAKSPEPASSTNTQPASVPTEAPAEPQVRRSTRHLKRSTKVAEEDEQKQQTTASSSAPPEHRFVCLLGDCDKSYKNFRDLNTHRSSKSHKEEKLNIANVGRHQVPFADFLTGKTQAKVPPSLKQQFRHLIESHSQQKSAQADPVVSAQASGTASKRKASPQVTAEGRKRPARGQGQRPDQAAQDREEPDVEVQNPQPTISSALKSSNASTNSQRAKRKRDNRTQASGSPPKKVVISIKLNVRSTETPPAESLAQPSQEEEAPKQPEESSRKVSRPAVARSKTPTLPAIDEENENDQAPATAPDALPSDDDNDDLGDDAGSSAPATGNGSEGQHMDRYRATINAPDYKRSARAKNRSRKSSYLVANGQQSLDVGQKWVKMVFDPTAVRDAVPVDRRLEVAEKKNAKKSKKDKVVAGKRNDNEEEFGNSVDRGPLLEAYTSGADAETIANSEIILAGAKKTNKAKVAANGTSQPTPAEANAKTDLDLREELATLLRENFLTTFRRDVLDDARKAAGGINNTLNPRRPRNTDGRETVQQEQERKARAHQANQDNILFLAAATAVDEMLRTHVELQRENERASRAQADEISRLRNQPMHGASMAVKDAGLRAKEAEIKAKDAEIAKLKDNRADGAALKAADEQLRAKDVKLDAQAREIDYLKRVRTLASFTTDEERKTLNEWRTELQSARRELERQKMAFRVERQDFEDKAHGQIESHRIKPVNYMTDAMLNADSRWNTESFERDYEEDRSSAAREKLSQSDAGEEEAEQGDELQ